MECLRASAFTHFGGTITAVTLIVTFVFVTLCPKGPFWVFLCVTALSWVEYKDKTMVHVVTKRPKPAYKP